MRRCKQTSAATGARHCEGSRPIYDQTISCCEDLSKLALTPPWLLLARSLSPDPSLTKQVFIVLPCVQQNWYALEACLHSVLESRALVSNSCCADVSEISTTRPAFLCVIFCSRFEVSSWRTGLTMCDSLPKSHTSPAR